VSGDALRSVVEYGALRDSLTRAGMLLTLPELHGNVCGMICGSGETAARRWVEEQLAEQFHDDAGRRKEVERTLDEMAHATSRMFGSAELEFEPLLPDDEAPLDEQIESLASWCQGFLAGLGLSRQPPESERLSVDVREILADFAEIARADVASGEGDQDGFALAELREYVRVGAQLVFEELAGREESESQ
jgi:uncharacterized protein